MVSLLLSHLPLLQPRNSEAKCEYMKLLQKVLSHTIDSSLFVEESRQLLSYALIHPATTLDDRTSLAMWLSHLEDHLSGGYAPRAPSSPYHPHQGSDEWHTSAEALEPGNAWNEKSRTSPVGQNGHMTFLGGMSSPINSNNAGNLRRGQEVVWLFALKVLKSLLFFFPYRSGRADAAQPREKVHNSLRSSGVRLRLGQPGRRGKPAELRLDGSRASFPPEQHRVVGQRADGGTGLRPQHLPGGRQWHERSGVIA